MWQRFTEGARKSVFYAQEEAQAFGEGYVSTEHILLGLLRDRENLACQVLSRLQSNIDEVVDTVKKQLPRGDARPNADMTLTPRAKRVIDLAYDEARILGNNYIGTEHLLLGLRREGDGLAGRSLAQCGVELEPLRQAVSEIQEELGYDKSEAKNPRTTSPSEQAWQHRVVMSRVKEWASWAQQLTDEAVPYEQDLQVLRERTQEILTDMQRSLLLGLCMEIAEGGSLEASENWQKLRLTAEQAAALKEIGGKAREVLKD
ncbi:MAG: hypothetical protein JST12_20750 [Armatimonadetes bacterium]|nr:hypothetical protein [Armatimonadota bacterium]